MIDFHTHILPGIDDGSRDMDMSMKMIRSEIEQGVDKIVLTPHFYAHKDTPDAFLQRRRQMYDELINSFDAKCHELSMHNKPSIEFWLGAEVFFFSGIGHSGRISDLCIEGTNIILLEMPFEQWTESVYQEVREIVEEQGLQVVLAHVERFYRYQRDMHVWNKIMSLKVVSQINAECFLNWRSRRFAYRFIDQRHKILIGTDAHNDSSRPVNIAAARRILEKKYGMEYFSEIDTFGRGILLNE